MENGILEVFPKLEKVPEEIGSKFKYMIACYLRTKRESSKLKPFRIFKHLGHVYNEEGDLVCLFKASRDAKREAAVYILDHPLTGHRSASSELIGFGGATPTSLHPDRGNIRMLGMFRTLPEEISRLSIFHLRFGCADSHARNTVTKVDAQKLHHLTPIDFEECFTGDYKLRRVWWDEREESKEAYSDQVVTYVVNRLDVDEDIAFLKRCGWVVPREISVPYKIFTFFVKMGVQLNLTAAHMVVIAQNNHKTQAFNLLNMLGDQTLEDDVFVQKSHEKIEDRLRQYSERFL
ncbi:phosphatidylinositol 4-kinase gamma 2-like [Raphanus sativus]|uniref:1-phosphatidylinositol 4-kinase n=1 Tax=Raphanus sativus TaxID=3726 RepID=A0A9W3D9A8_RAPSA|nr:phosphatidylinositol 4-kinase gamma 2-like [Raphanus sativus]